MPNRLTSVYSKNYYEEENYLKVKTVIFKYITPPYSNSWFVLIFLHVLHTEFDMLGTQVYLIRSLWLVMWFSYPLSYNSTSSISFISRALILIQYKFSLSTCTVLYIRSVISLVWYNLLRVTKSSLSNFIVAINTQDPIKN